MNLLFRDPHSYKAETFDQAVVKLEKLIEQSSNPAADWAENIISATVNLKEEYQEEFIRYLANPANCTADTMLCTQKENMNMGEDFKKRHPNVDFDQLQRYEMTKEVGTTMYIGVEPVPCTEDSSDDEKVQEQVFTQ